MPIPPSTRCFSTCPRPPSPFRHVIDHFDNPSSYCYHYSACRRCDDIFYSQINVRLNEFVSSIANRHTILRLIGPMLDRIQVHCVIIILSDYERSSAESLPRLSKAGMQASIASAFEPFKQYIQYLATGKLDGYLDSVDSKDKLAIPGLIMSTDPHLLLHDLGKYTDKERVGRLFQSDTTSVILNYTCTIISNCLLAVKCSKPRVLARPVCYSKVSATIGDFIFLAPPKTKGLYLARAISRLQSQHYYR